MTRRRTTKRSGYELSEKWAAIAAAYGMDGVTARDIAVVARVNSMASVPFMESKSNCFILAHSVFFGAGLQNLYRRQRFAFYVL